MGFGWQPWLHMPRLHTSVGDMPHLLHKIRTKHNEDKFAAKKIPIGVK